MAHKHDERTYETTQVIGTKPHPVTGAEIDELATYTGCATCGKITSDAHGVAPTE